MCFAVATVVALVLMIPRSSRPRAKRVAKIGGAGAAVSFVAMAVLAYQEGQASAVRDGWTDVSEKQAAARESVTDPMEWRRRVASTEAERAAAAERTRMEEAEASRLRDQQRASDQAAADQKAEAERKARQEQAQRREEAIRPSLEQIRFVNAVGNAKTKYGAASNDFQRGATRPDPAEAVCTALKGVAVKDWVGKVDQLTTNSDGKGVLGLEIADGVRVSTWNNAMSDIGSDTLIEPGAAMYRSMGTVEKGDYVRFSGRFLRSDVDCIQEQSVTMDGSMRYPEFTFRFGDIRRINGID